MHTKTTFLLTTFILLSLTTSVLALEQADCVERLQFVDERIATGKYPKINVQLAEQVRAQAMQICGEIDEAHFSQLVDSFEELLPTRSEAERAADREATRLARKAERERQSAELDAERAERARQKVEVKRLPVSDILKGPAAARANVAKFIDHDDDMHMVTILDRDNYQGNARILYVAHPSRDQLNWPGAKRHYYVLVCDENGNITQHAVTDMPLGQVAAAGLRPGQDEVIFQLPTAPPALGSRIELWSISGGKLLSSSVVPMLPWSGRNWDSNRDFFRLTTGDGNLLFAGHSVLSRDKHAVAWLKSSPEGEVLGQGARVEEAGSAMSDTWFRTRDGGGFIIAVHSIENTGIQTDLDTPLIESVDGVTLEGYVFRETRLLVTAKDASVAWESPALERTFLWQGLDTLGQRGSSLSALEKASVLTSTSDSKYGADNQLVRFSIGNGRSGAVTAIGDGFGVLLQTANLYLGGSAVRGKWLYEYTADRQVRKTDLTAAAEYLKGRFIMVGSPDANTVYLYAETGASRDTRIIKLNSDRKIAAYGTVTMGRNVEPRGMLTDRLGVWVIGRGIASGEKRRVWLERIDFE